MTEHVEVDEALVGPSFEPNGVTRLTLEGDRVRSVEAVAALHGARRLLLPALANAHDHARPLSSTSFGAAGKPLESWLPRLAVIPSVDPYLAAAAPLARAALGGCACVMVHYTRSQGFTDLPREALEVRRAAEDVGVRVGFAVALKDRNPLVYGDHDALLGTLPASARDTVRAVFEQPPQSVAAQLEKVDAVADAAAGPGFDVQYGPAGVQWCSGALLEAVAAASAETGRRVHMHLLETPYQRAYADRVFPGGMVRYLRDIGLLSPRLTLAHCTYARPDELELIAEAGALISVNTSSNLHLRSGIAPLTNMVELGCRVGLGVDGTALDEDDDAVRELRLARLLHGGWGFETRLADADVLGAACRSGRDAVGAPPGGTLETGQSADLLVMDLDALDRDALMPVDARELLFARANRRHIRALFVGGRQVIRDGRLTGLDLDAVHAELRDRMRTGLAGSESLLAAWPVLEPALQAYYRNHGGCC